MATTHDDGLRQLVAEGVAPWLDGVSQDMLVSGRLTRLVTESALRGVTFNIEVFTAAVARDQHYRDRLAMLAKRDIPSEMATRSLLVYDARIACTELSPAFETGEDLGGRVSLDLDPMLTRDVPSAVREAAEVSRLVNRANLLVKVPATEHGVAAARACLGAGIGVHLSDIFSVRRLGEAMDAYFDGLELALAAGLRPAEIGMVASLPVGRIDEEFDARLHRIGTSAAEALRGQGALAVARLAYQLCEQRLGTDRWRSLNAAGARPIRLMWTDTTAHDPTFPTTWYVDEFVAWGTANAMSPRTLDAVADTPQLHGDTLTNEHERATAVLQRFEHLGISADAVASRLKVMSASRRVDVWRALRTQVATLLGASAEERC